MAFTEQPKKPMCSYWLFLDEQRAAIVKELGSAKGSEVSKKAGEQWKALSPEERKPFEERAAKLKAEYEQAIQAFKDEGGVMAARKSKKDKEDKKAKKDPNEPKRPAGGGYGVYMKEQRDEITKGLPAEHKITDVAKVGGAKWKALPEAEQKVYTDKYVVLKEEFDKAHAEWKAGQVDDEEEDTKEAASPPSKPTTLKRALDKSSEKKEPKAKKSKSSAQKDGPEIEEEVLEASRKLQMEGALKNLAARSEIVALKLPAQKILSALEASNGLVNAAKHALLGA